MEDLERPWWREITGWRGPIPMFFCFRARVYGVSGRGAEWGKGYLKNAVSSTLFPLEPLTPYYSLNSNPLSIR